MSKHLINPKEKDVNKSCEEKNHHVDMSTTIVNMAFVVDNHYNKTALTLTAGKLHARLMQTSKHGVYTHPNGVTLIASAKNGLFDSFRKVIISSARYELAWTSEENLMMFLAKVSDEANSQSITGEVAVAIESLFDKAIIVE